MALLVDLQTIARPTALAARAIVYEVASGKNCSRRLARPCPQYGNTTAVKIMKAGYPWASI